MAVGPGESLARYGVPDGPEDLPSIDSDPLSKLMIVALLGDGMQHVSQSYRRIDQTGDSIMVRGNETINNCKYAIAVNVCGI